MTDKPKETIYIVIHETVLQSWMVDASTWALSVCLIIPGWMMGSGAMQWLGFFALLGITARRRSGKILRMTTAEARAEMDRIDAKNAKVRA